MNKNEKNKKKTPTIETVGVDLKYIYKPYKISKKRASNALKLLKVSSFAA